MIRYLRHGDIDFIKWDAAIDASPFGMVYAKSWFLDIVSPGWEALADDEYKNVFPLTWRSKYGIHYLHQPFFTQQLGIFSETQPSEDSIQKFLSSIPKKFRLVEIQLNHGNPLPVGSFAVTKRLTHHLGLAHRYEDLRRNYSEGHKRKLKLAQENALSVTEDFETSELIGLFRRNRGKEVGTLKEKDYSTFEKIVEEGRRRNLITKAGIKTGNNLEAGAVFLKSNHEYIFLFSATGEKAKETGAMTMIIDHFIQSHAGENMLLDFEGSMDAGLARFYKSFGSKEIVYLQIRKNNLPLLIRWIR